MDKISEAFRKFFFTVIGIRFIKSARASLDFPNITAGLQAVLTITATGAALGDLCLWGVETVLEAGLEVTAYVSAADTVTVICINNTAGAIDPTAKAFIVSVHRRGA